MHKRIEDYPGLIAQIEGAFKEMDSGFTVALRESDEEYAELRKYKKEIAERHPFVEPFLDGDNALSLSVDEYLGLTKYLKVNIEMEYRERLNLYYAGHRDCFAYLRRIGVI